MQSWDEISTCSACVGWQELQALLCDSEIGLGLYHFPISAFIIGCSRGESYPLTVWLSFFQVTQYLLDQSFVMDEETLYEASLRIEPKLPS